ncbi:MAG: hypothetical protein ABUL44_02960, partial [Flavobacterium sp.]
MIILLMEITIGGGGRLTALGPVTLRMILFFMAIIFSIVALINGEKISKEFKILLSCFSATIAIAWARGIYNGAQPQYWWEDVKPLLYFFILPFFVIAFKNEVNITNASKIFRFCALFLMTAFFGILFSIHTNLIGFHAFYDSVLNKGEFFFRGEITFFYKGFLYLCIGLLFMHFSNQRYKTILIILLLLAVLLTFTRGFLLALCLTFAVYYFFNYKHLKAALFTTLAILIIGFGQAAITTTSQAIDILRNRNKVSSLLSRPGTNENQNTPQKNLLGNREFSDDGRLQQIREVKECITPVSFLIG